jgi:hypothetical protein
MKLLIKKIYNNLPIVRELNLIRNALYHQHSQLAKIDNQCSGLWRLKQHVECSAASYIELLQINNERYRDPKRLTSYGAQYWSQNFEDGMIEEIFRRIGIANKTFVEIGIGDGTETNTTALLSNGWSGWWFEADPTACKKIRARLTKFPELGNRIKLQETFVEPSKISDAFNKVGIPQEVDLFSLDIDYNTYHVWEALNNFKPRVVVVEYNSAISSCIEWVANINESAKWDATQCFGASLKALEILGKEKDYCLVGCDLTGINAFFVRRDLISDSIFSEPFTAENHYEPARYFLINRSLHRPDIF